MNQNALAVAPEADTSANPVIDAYLSLDPPTQVHLARICGQKPQAVTRWINERVVPGKYALAIESASGVSRHRLCPEVFGPESNLIGVENGSVVHAEKACK